jgi:hypothetical protein
LQAGFVPGRWRCPIRAPSLLRSAAIWLISWAVPFVESCQRCGRTSLQSWNEERLSLACGWLEPLPSLQRGIKSDYLFRDRSVRPLLLPLLAVRQLSEPQPRSSLVSRAARRSLKAPDSGSGNARRKASPTWPAACFGSIGARRAARSAEVVLSTIPRAPQSLPKPWKPQRGSQIQHPDRCQVAQV